MKYIRWEIVPQNRSNKLETSAGNFKTRGERRVIEKNIFF